VIPPERTAEQLERICAACDESYGPLRNRKCHKAGKDPCGLLEEKEWWQVNDLALKGEA